MWSMPYACGGLSGPLFLLFLVCRTFLVWTFLIRTFLMAPQWAEALQSHLLLATAMKKGKEVVAYRWTHLSGRTSRRRPSPSPWSWSGPAHPWSGCKSHDGRDVGSFARTTEVKRRLELLKEKLARESWKVVVWRDSFIVINSTFIANEKRPLS